MTWASMGMWESNPEPISLGFPISFLVLHPSLITPLDGCTQPVTKMLKSQTHGNEWTQTKAEEKKEKGHQQSDIQRTK